MNLVLIQFFHFVPTYLDSVLGRFRYAKFYLQAESSSKFGGCSKAKFFIPKKLLYFWYHIPCCMVHAKFSALLQQLAAVPQQYCKTMARLQLFSISLQQFCSIITSWLVLSFPICLQHYCNLFAASLEKHCIICHFQQYWLNCLQR